MTTTPSPAAVRVDVWLWSVRAVKTRSLATSACRAGHVRLRGERAKASDRVRIGDEVRIRVEGFDRVYRVKELLTKRVGAPRAALAYEDLSPPKPNPLDAPAAIIRDRGAGRPTKRERRELERLRGYSRE